MADDLTTQRHDRLRRIAPAVQHDINNAMMVLASNLELLGRSVADGAPRRQLDRCVEAQKRLDATMRGFLDAARRPVEEPTRASLAQALRQVLPLLTVAAGARHGVDLTLPEGVPEVALDRARLDLALLAMVQDAVPELPPGARIGLALEKRDGAVAVVVTLPEGGAVSDRAMALLAEAATGGTLETGPVLTWPTRPA
ncbi:HAMP domain-containing histidine kinase [Roseomonas stagni]|uniref:HAMP domain-containing histidine kinase n=1 Tax=Falsiroseomonas algicola TaxID=2716930 RepID=A0A6M1LMM3_9PROT|nr:HAMP domain-containing histidine kinase [Falsiroseomonas algicola]NGM21611.1 HAMP domain-containing histidine kinase [Falsiroseomonas algicola]